MADETRDIKAESAYLQQRCTGGAPRSDLVSGSFLAAIAALLAGISTLL